MTVSVQPFRRAALAAAAAPALDHPVAAPRRTLSPLTLVGPGRRSGPPRRAPRTPFVMLLLVLMGTGLLGLLLLNTALTEDAFRLHGLQQQAKTLAEQEQELSLEVDALSDPATLASRATELGMVAGSGLRHLPPGAPIPPGARVVAGEPGSSAVLVIIPAPPAPPPAPPAPAGAGAPAGADGASTVAAGAAGAAGALG